MLYASVMEGDALRQFIERHSRLFILTGAGCSTDSGIPDYRDADGGWKRAQPVQFRAFMDEPLTRKRYWARSLVGWRRFGRARPNDAHRALAALERQGRVGLLVTQNVDRLHQAAGSEAVVDLHGRLDTVRCMDCERLMPREALQQELLQHNREWADLDAWSLSDSGAPSRGRPPSSSLPRSFRAHSTAYVSGRISASCRCGSSAAGEPESDRLLVAPDGDADLTGLDFFNFNVPACAHCGGLLKPDVVFYGESVPRERVERARQAVAEADAMLVVGSSLMVYSGYRFAREAALAGKPIAAVNLGRTRADDLISLKVTQSCASALAFLLEESDLA